METSEILRYLKRLTPEEIRSRLSELDREARTLRALLRASFGRPRDRKEEDPSDAK